MPGLKSIPHSHTICSWKKSKRWLDEWTIFSRLGDFIWIGLQGKTPSGSDLYESYLNYERSFQYFSRHIGSVPFFVLITKDINFSLVDICSLVFASLLPFLDLWRWRWPTFLDSFGFQLADSWLFWYWIPLSIPVPFNCTFARAFPPEAHPKGFLAILVLVAGLVLIFGEPGRAAIAVNTGARLLWAAELFLEAHLRPFFIVIVTFWAFQRPSYPFAQPMFASAVVSPAWKAPVPFLQTVLGLVALMLTGVPHTGALLPRALLHRVALLGRAAVLRGSLGTFSLNNKYLNIKIWKYLNMKIFEYDYF